MKTSLQSVILFIVLALFASFKTNNQKHNENEKVKHITTNFVQDSLKKAESDVLYLNKKELEEKKDDLVPTTFIQDNLKKAVADVLYEKNKKLESKEEEYEPTTFVQNGLKKATERVLKEKTKSEKKESQPSQPTTVTPTNQDTSYNSPQGAYTNTNNNSQVGYNSNVAYQNPKQPQNPDDHFFYQRNIQCSNKNCPLPFGTCMDDKTCRCLDGYANFVPEGKETYGYYCSYQQKKQVTAFLLEFFLSMGVGHFYSGRTTFGVIKLLIELGPLIMGILMCCSVLIKDTSSCMGLFIMISVCAFVCTSLVWQLVDLIMFGINNYRDGYGVPLQHW